MIRIALQNNRDLRVAVANIGAAQGLFKAQGGALFPAIAATGSADILGEPTTTALPLTGGLGSGHETVRIYSAGIGFTKYELDLFGRLRSLTRAQYELLMNAVHTRWSVQISVVAAVGNAYITLLADEAQLGVARQTLDLQGRSYALTKALFNRGATNLLTLAQAETTVDTARASVAQFVRQVAQDKNALTLVVGAPLPETLPPGRDLLTQDIMSNLPAGLPSRLLTHRPDIMAAEHTLLSDNALIGAARAAFFPQITLTASGGLQSNILHRLFTAGAETWTFSPNVTIPIFTWGSNEGLLENAKFVQQADLAAYEKTIQTAFREVSDALAARGTYLDQLAAQDQLVKSNRTAYQIADLRFRTGTDDFLATLQAQQALFKAQQDLIALKALQLQNLIALYKALGGGWYDTTLQGAAAMTRMEPADEKP